MFECKCSTENGLRPMPMPAYHDERLTEKRNPQTQRIDEASALEIVDALNAEDRRVPEVVHGAREAIARVIDLVVSAFREGGRLVYVGAGTSGRLGALDAAECPPTFGTPPEMVVAILAGGPAALTGSREGAEDDAGAGAIAMDGAGISGVDVVVGIAASGTTPYVRAALERSAALGSQTVLVTCSDPPPALASTVDVAIVLRVGPEALTGSTRLKAGTATKLVLNAITTGAMIRSGRAYGNLMVDLVALSDKLRDRGERIVMETGRVSRAAARGAIEAAGGSVKTAIVMIRRNVGPEEARRLLAAADGSVRGAAGDPPPVGS
jgi:N-acetylmuramic acid 6-phosphate etherase